jgi:hypothetical protein
MTTPNLQLLQSQRLTDNPNGGGAMTNDVIPDNQADNLFSAISRINRSNGNVSLRKAFAMARSADTKQYLGAHAIIASPPVNEGVSALMFSTGSWSDTRAEAANFVESYLVQGPQTRLWAFGQQVKGQRSIIAYQPTTEALPSVGETYVLVDRSVEPNLTQFLRLTSISSRTGVFTDSSGTFELTIVTMGISSPLQFTFRGAEAQRYSVPEPPTVLCTTTVADAAVYYGVERLSADANAGDESVTLGSIFGQLVPSTQGEVPLTNVKPTGATALVAASLTKVLTIHDLAPNGTMYAGIALYPGSIEIRDSANAVHAVDDGSGNLRLGTTISGSIVGAVDYNTGQFNFPSPFMSTTFGYFYAIPAVSVSQGGFFAQQPITQSTRGYLYVQTLTPLPAPGSLIVSYRSLGQWYDLRDDGSGTLLGANGAGSGSIRFDTGDLQVTLGALPDIGSNIIFSWGQASQYEIRTGDTAIQIPAIQITLSSGVKTGSVSITYTAGGSTKTVTDDGAGNLTGNGTGSIDYGGGIITLRPSSLPNPGAGVSVAYQTNPATVENLTPSKSGSDLILTATGHPIKPHSVRITYDLAIPSTLPASISLLGVLGGNAFAMVVTDDGAGGLVNDYFGPISGGTVDYTTGVITFDPDIIWPTNIVPVYEQQPQWFFDQTLSPPAWAQRNVQVLTGYNTELFTLPFTNGSAIKLSYAPSTATNTPTTENFPSPTITLDLTPTTVLPIVQGSVMFRFAGDTYFDRAGALYRSISGTTGAGIIAGSMDYTSGIASLTSWPSGASSTGSIVSLLTQLGLLPIAQISSRVAGQSVRPSSFTLRFNRVSDSTLVQATADVNGDLSATGIRGHIDVTTGFFSAQFGNLVLDSSLTSDDKAEPWYNPANVDGTGHIWRPDEALPGSIKYSCVVETFLPLSASVLGLDPVRLPLDGRVQIVRAGDTQVFRNPLVYNVTGTPTASSTITLPRGGLETAVLFDSEGTQVDTVNYMADLEDGTITMASSINLSAYTGPFTVTHTTADMVLITDVQITGEVAFTPSLVNSYPHASSYVSGALIAPNSGNLQADYTTLFAQTTWNYNPANLWEDQVQGSSPTAEFDDINFPIEVVDRDAITQRWSLIFTSATTGNVASEDFGVVAAFNTSTDVAPLNPATSNPYFILDHRGFGSGWSTGNAIRFNTVGAGFPIWVARSVQVGTVGSSEDSFSTELRWDE